MKQDNHFDVVVIGGGHAGIEAALAATRLGTKTCLITMNNKAIGRMSCNPAIGGLAKGQMVREIDVLGGIMGMAADCSGLQFKILNRSKGRSVWSPRAQTDKRVYEKYVNSALSLTKNLTIIEDEVVKFLLSKNKISGILTRGGIRFSARAAVLTCGTFLSGLIHIGERKIRAGRMGEERAEGVTEFLVSLGFRSGRLKTGTPPRLNSATVSWEKLDLSFGDEDPSPFSFRTEFFNPKNIPCHAVQTNLACHEIIANDLYLSPMFSGDVIGIGPRYCPSIEDKVHRFRERDSHLLFLEPEWEGSNQIYLNGFSTSLPETTQLKALRAIPGLERVDFFRPGYAIEYDFFPSSQLKASLESKAIGGLFFAGQINGTSGYEEAAAQGLVAGANAAYYLFGKDPITLGRDEAYIGVLIDDLITKESLEPYRMFTSRAEHRLVIRHSNAGERLAKKSLAFGLITNETFDKINKNLTLEETINKDLDITISPDRVNPVLVSRGENPLKHSIALKTLLKRPTMSIFDFIQKEKYRSSHTGVFLDEVLLEVETKIKYAGYIKRQNTLIASLKNNENNRIPESLNYTRLVGLSNESREKLQRVRPETLGQASRISGVSPADIAVLSIFLHS